MLRASHACTYNASQSTENEPFYDHVNFLHIGIFPLANDSPLQDRREPVQPGTIVPLEIGIWPTGIVLQEGEGIMIRVAGHVLLLAEVSTFVNFDFDIESRDLQFTGRV